MHKTKDKLSNEEKRRLIRIFNLLGFVAGRIKTAYLRNVLHSLASIVVASQRKVTNARYAKLFEYDTLKLYTYIYI